MMMFDMDQPLTRPIQRVESSNLHPPSAFWGVPKERWANAALQSDSESAGGEVHDQDCRGVVEEQAESGPAAFNLRWNVKPCAPPQQSAKAAAPPQAAPKKLGGSKAPQRPSLKVPDVYSSGTAGVLSPGGSNVSEVVDPPSPHTGADSHPHSPKSPVGGRTCVSCGTQKTPLWRNGPAGAKTLCNACGIRFKKLGKRNGTDAPPSPLSKTPKTALKKAAAGASKKRSPKWSEGEEQRPLKQRKMFNQIKMVVAKAREQMESDYASQYKRPLQGFSVSVLGDNVTGSIEEGAELLMLLSYSYHV